MTATIDNGAKLAFEQNFLMLSQQERSKLEASPAVKYIDPNAKTHNIGRMHSLELQEVPGRNPEKNFVDYMLDNRRFTKKRFSASILIDRLKDVNELIADPTSDLMQNLMYAKKRVIDRVIAEAALGPVLVGAPETNGNLVSATDDGVITIDATSGLTATKIQEITENFINVFVFNIFIDKTCLLFTGRENTALMNEEKFINSDYISGHPIESGVQKSVSGYNVILFAGSSTGAGTKANPILKENGTVRSCLALAPNSIAVMMELDKFSVIDSPLHINSRDITVDFWINAMRIDGKRVQEIKTTI